MDTPPKISWRYRRTMGFAIAAYSMTSLTWLMWYGQQEGSLHKLMTEGHLWILVAIFLVYVAGATLQDVVALLGSWRGGDKK